MKNEFDMLNDVKNKVDNIEEIILSNEEKKNINNRVLNKLKGEKRKRNKKAVLAATLVIALTGCFALTNESVIAQMSSIGRKLENFFGTEDNSLKKYKKDILQVTEDKGIKFMLHEVMVDDKELYMSASIDYSDFDRNYLKTNHKGKLNIVPSVDSAKVNISLNGKELNIPGTGGSYEYNDDGTVDMFLTYNIEDGNLESIYDINFKIDKMETQPMFKDHEIIDGNWELNFKVDGMEMVKEMKVIDINKEINIEYKKENILILIEDMSISPIAMRVNFKRNPIDLDEKYRIDFKFKDENDEEIAFISQGGSIDEMSYKWIIDKEIKEVKIVPVIYKDDNIFKGEKEFETVNVRIK